MPIQLLWDDTERAILHQVFTTSFNLNEWYEAISQTCIILNDVRHPVNIILDLSSVEQLPCEWIQALSQSKTNYHENLVMQVAIVKQSHVKALETLLNPAELSSGIQVVSTFSEAKHIFNNTALSVSTH